MPDNVFMVYDGWQYADTLIRFFEDEIRMPYEICSLFSDTFHAEVDILDLPKTRTSLDGDDSRYSNLKQFPRFYYFVETACVNVDFIVPQ